MLNNRIDSIKMQSSKKKISRQNLSHDVSTSYAFGEVQPSLCLEMLPDSKAVLSKEHLVRPDPVVAPAFGRIVCKNHTRFVPMENIWPAYGSMLTQTPFSYAGLTTTPKQLPTITLGLLSLMCLVGAKCSIYEVGLGGVQSYICPQRSSSHYNNIVNAINGWFGSSDWNNRGQNTLFGITQGEMLNISASLLVGHSFGDSARDYRNVFIPLANDEVFIPSDSETAKAKVPLVGIGEYDLLIERMFTSGSSTQAVGFAFKLSAFGKRIRKILIGLGYEINPDSRLEVSILPLLACYSAYYDTYSSKQWTNYNDTFAAALIGQLLLRLDNFGPPQKLAVIDWLCSNNDTSVMQPFFRFIMSLGDCWYQQEMDFVAAHTANVANSTHTLKADSFIDVDLNGNITKASDAVSDTHDVRGSFNQNPHSVIYRLQHSMLDDKILQRMYRFVNRDSIIGQEVIKQLEARGYGEWMKSNPSYYVGHYDFPVRFSEEVSTADTYNRETDTGASVGEYGGRALGYGESDTFRFTTREPGYLITLSSVVPLAGYSQALDLRLLGKDIYSIFNPEFEALGPEASPKAVLQGSLSRCSCSSSSGSMDETFGFVPRGSRYKVFPNRMNGDFSLHSTRNSYLPYTLDKVINVNELVDVRSLGFENGAYGFVARPSLPPSAVPHADILWQYPTKYGYLANFWRIFALQGDMARNPESYLSSQEFYLTHQEYDCFKSHIVVNLQFYAHMDPIEESYETDLNDSGRFDMSAKKQ